MGNFDTITKKAIMRENSMDHETDSVNSWPMMVKNMKENGKITFDMDLES